MEQGAAVATSHYNGSLSARRASIFLSVALVAGVIVTAATPARSTTEGTWRAEASLNVQRWRLAAVGDANGRIYAIGGFTGIKGTETNTAEYLNTLAPEGQRQWKQTKPMAAPRFGHGAAASGELVYAIGGVSLNTVEAYVPSADVWVAMPPLSATRTNMGTTTGGDGRIYVIGGLSNDFGEAYDTVEVYTPGQGSLPGSWQTLTAKLTDPRHSLAAATGKDGRIYAIGGRNAANQKLDTVEVYDPANAAAGWQVLTARLTMVRSEHAAATDDAGRLYAAGGQQVTGGASSTVEVYDPAAPDPQWRLLPGTQPDQSRARGSGAGNMLSQRVYLGAATGKDGRMYAVGGRDDGNNLATAESYQPAGVTAPTTTTPTPTTTTTTAPPPPRGPITEYVVPPPTQNAQETAEPEGITTGPDGHLWVTELGRGRVHRLSPTGTFTHDLPSSHVFSRPGGIATGPDGNVWFAQRRDRIGRITPPPPQPSVAHFDPVPGGASTCNDGLGVDSCTVVPVDIAPGPSTASPALWFTGAGGTGGFSPDVGRIGRMTTAGTVTDLVTLPTPGSRPEQITSGSDGGMWFTESGTHYVTGGAVNQIGRIDPTTLELEEYPVPTPGAAPFGITAGPDGAIWFTEFTAGKIGRLDPRTKDVTEFELDPESQPAGITAGPDGALWFTERATSKIGRITTDGTSVVEFDTPTPNSRPTGITTGPDGAVWFTEQAAGKVGRIEPTATPSPGRCATPPPPPAAAGAWSPIAPMCQGRAGLATATGGDGRIYAIGGYRWVCQFDANGSGSCRGEFFDTVEAYLPAHDRWTAVDARLATARARHAAVADRHGRIYVIGGDGDGGTLRTVEVYDPANPVAGWRAGPSLSQARSALAAALGHDGRIYAVGGYRFDCPVDDPTGATAGTVCRAVARDLVEVYDPERPQDGWKAVKALPAPRSSLAATTGPDGRIYAIGGERDAGGPGVALDRLGLAAPVGDDEPDVSRRTVESYDPATDTWRSEPPLLTERTNLATATGGDGRIYALGGSNRYTNAEAYEPGAKGWVLVDQMTTDRHSHGAATGPDGRIYAVGGLDVSDILAMLPTGEAYTRPAAPPPTPTACSRPATPEATGLAAPQGEWRALAPMPTAREGGGAALGPDGCIYAVGGSTEPAAVDSYDPRTGTWEKVAPLPTPRHELAAAAGLDGRIYTFGGQHRLGGSSQIVDTVEAYDARTNTWKARAPMPVPRFQHVAATGRDGRIYVMGGFQGRTLLNRVDVYDPRTDSWAAAEAMPVRRNYLAAATGPDGRIYLTGGNGQDSGTADYVYDPARDTWSAIAPMPTFRYHHAAATGPDGRIYTMGGCAGQCFAPPVATVEAYDPCSGRWQSSSARPGAPAELPPMPTRRDGLAAVTAADGRIVALGGKDDHAERDFATPRYRDEAEAYRVRDAGVRRLTILDAPPVREPSTGETTARFTVRLSAPACYPVSVSYVTSPGSAAPDFDYRTTAGRVVFAPSQLVLQPGETERTVTVPVFGDDLPEPDEDFFVTLVDPEGAALDTDAGSARATILDAGPAVSVGDVRVEEPSSGSVPATFTVTLSGSPLGPVSVRYDTADASATAGRDYTATSGVLRFEPGAGPEARITVPVKGDTEPEDDETFSVVLSQPDGAYLRRGVGSGSIGDAQPGVSVGDATVVEPDEGEVTAVFAVTLGEPRDRPVTVEYTTADGSATAGADYRPAAGTLSFAPGEVASTVEVSVLGDRRPEPTERFSVNLAAVAGAELGRRSGTGTILDRDVAPDGASSPPAPGQPSQGGPLRQPTEQGVQLPVAQQAAQPPAQQAAQPQANPQQVVQQVPASQAAAPQTAAQSQTQQQLQQQQSTAQQVQQSTQHAVQGALVAEREHEVEVARARPRADPQRPSMFMASARRAPSPLPLAALALAGSVIAVATGLAVPTGGQTARTVRVLPARSVQRRRRRQPR